MGVEERAAQPCAGSLGQRADQPCKGGRAGRRADQGEGTFALRLLLIDFGGCEVISIVVIVLQVCAKAEGLGEERVQVRELLPSDRCSLILGGVR